jgi:F0F1-type ATP synthase assembly protein I
MAKLDRTKEFINYLKVFLVLLLATLVGLIGWLATNYENTTRSLVLSSVLIIGLIMIAIILINKKILSDIKSLEDL